jgi:hypothetical protein
MASNTRCPFDGLAGRSVPSVKELAGTQSDTMDEMTRLLIQSLGTIALASLPIFAQARVGTRELSGKVVDQTGVGVADATIVASGTGFSGWASSNAEGLFHLKASGGFISVRHVGLTARLLRTSELAEPILIKLEAADNSVRNMPACNSSSAARKQWIGGGLKVNPGRSRFRGPVNGEHDSHWYVTFRKEVLHIVDGYAWHAGLPLEQQLTSSDSISVRSWEFKDIVGLDLSGQTKNGARWRWLGAPIAAAVEYRDAPPESAEFFNRIMESTCFGSATVTK